MTKTTETSTSKTGGTTKAPDTIGEPHVPDQPNPVHAENDKLMAKEAAKAAKAKEEKK